MYALKGAALRPKSSRGAVYGRQWQESIPRNLDKTGELENAFQVKAFRSPSSLRFRGQQLMQELTKSASANAYKDNLDRIDSFSLQHLDSLTKSIILDVDRCANNNNDPKQIDTDIHEIDQDYVDVMRHALTVYNKYKSGSETCVDKIHKTEHRPHKFASKSQLSCISLNLCAEPTKTKATPKTTKRPKSALLRNKTYTEKRCIHIDRHLNQPKPISKPSVELRGWNTYRTAANLLHSSTLGISGEAIDIDNNIIHAVSVANGLNEPKKPADQTQFKQPSVRQSCVGYELGGDCCERPKRHEYRIENPCFSRQSGQQRPYFTIHPEWASESLFIQGKSVRENVARKTSPIRELLPSPRRCKSAPPTRSRNPITWENW